MAPMDWRRIVLAVALASGLAWYYCTASLEHARVVNTVKARGDQSAYLFEAQILYRNWHGLNDPPVVQPRNRMPLYPAFLASFYEPAWTDWEFFDIAKAASVYLSLALLATLGVVLFWQVPWLPAANLLGNIAFGYFVFKAGYTQSELLFYTLHLLTFVACWRMFVDQRSSRRLWYVSCRRRPGRPGVSHQGGNSAIRRPHRGRRNRPRPVGLRTNAGDREFRA